MSPAAEGSGGPSALRLTQGIVYDPKMTANSHLTHALDLLLDRAPPILGKCSLGIISLETSICQYPIKKEMAIPMSPQRNFDPIVPDNLKIFEDQASN